MLVTRKSSITGVVHTKELNVTEEQFTAFNNGALIQEAFPHLNAGDREFILSGITQEEWDEHMSFEENDEE